MTCTLEGEPCSPFRLFGHPPPLAEIHSDQDAMILRLPPKVVEQIESLEPLNAFGKPTDFLTARNLLPIDSFQDESQCFIGDRVEVCLKKPEEDYQFDDSGVIDKLVDPQDESPRYAFTGKGCVKLDDMSTLAVQDRQALGLGFDDMIRHEGELILKIGPNVSKEQALEFIKSLALTKKAGEELGYSVESDDSVIALSFEPQTDPIQFHINSKLQYLCSFDDTMIGQVHLRINQVEE